MSFQSFECFCEDISPAIDDLDDGGPRVVVADPPRHAAESAAIFDRQTATVFDRRLQGGELISLNEVSAVHLESQPAHRERPNLSAVIVITAGLDADLPLAEARFLCERLVTESQPEIERKVNRVRWLGPVPRAKVPSRPDGAPDRAGGP